MATILIVEDYPVTQRMLSYTLQKEGYTVLIAPNGLEAIRVLRTTSVDVVLTDIAMPQMDGLALLRQIRGDDRFRALPVIVITASGQDEDRAAASADGANDFLTKPTSSRELLETVSRWLAGGNRNATMP